MTDQDQAGDEPRSGADAEAADQDAGAREGAPSQARSGQDDPSEGGAASIPGFPDITADGDIEEDLLGMVEAGERLQAERDEYLDLARRVQAEFENYKRRVEAQRVEQRERAAEDLARELLPVLDAGEAAVNQGHEHAAALHTQLLLTLEKQGLTKVDAVNVEFDPKIHEAVLHEEGDVETPEVSEVMRTGYLWNDRVIRPAMVKVRG